MGKSVRVSRTNGRRRKFHRDLISDLPEGVISHILSRLPITDGLRTSVLAKGWKVKWKSIYNVRFADKDIKTTEKSSFFDFMLKTLVNLENIESFSLYCSEAYDLGSIQACLNYVCRHNIRSFKVFMRDNQEAYGVELSSPFILFVSLLNCKSLEKLKLLLPCIFKVLPRNEFQNLKKLHIDNVRISNMNTLPDSVFFSFPVLEHFGLHDYEWSNVKSVEIYAPKLIRYECEPRNCQNYEYSIKIVGAKLKEFIIHGSFVENFDLAGSTVMNAQFNSYNLYNDDNDALMKLGLQTRKVLRGCSSIKRLDLEFLSKALAKSKACLSLPLFHKLEILDITCYIDVEGLFEVLHATPYLKILNLFDSDTVIWQDYDFGVEKCVPSCVVSCLEKVTIACYLGATTAPQFELVRFLVENGAVLKTLIFYKYDEANTSEICSKLSTFSKASSCLEIVQDNTWKEKGIPS